MAGDVTGPRIRDLGYEPDDDRLGACAAGARVELRVAGSGEMLSYGTNSLDDRLGELAQPERLDTVCGRDITRAQTWRMAHPLAGSILYQWNYTGEVCFQRPQDTDELSLADQAAPLNGAADDLEPHRW